MTDKRAKFDHDFDDEEEDDDDDEDEVVDEDEEEEEILEDKKAGSNPRNIVQEIFERKRSKLGETVDHQVDRRSSSPSEQMKTTSGDGRQVAGADEDRIKEEEANEVGRQLKSNNNDESESEAKLDDQ